MFSVIIPLYNKEAYVEKAVESVLRQTFSAFELIIVDDGSTDDGLEKVVTQTDSRLKVFRQANAGVSSARNIGTEQARFDYVAFLDADDWWDDHFLEKMHNLINNYPEAGLYGCGYYLVKNGTLRQALVGIPEGFTAGYINYPEVYAGTFWAPINCSFVVVKKDVFLEVGGFTPSLKFGEDFDLWIRIAQRQKVAYLKKALAYSNQDVEIHSRALGPGKLWKQEEHFIFNLGFLSQAEKDLPEVKVLLDGLRVRSLVSFYLGADQQEEVNNLLSQVNWQKQPTYYRWLYHSPRWVGRAYLQIKQVASDIKKTIVRLRIKL
jgi:glycosyltransferase involved in cell wall biosynthesis